MTLDITAEIPKNSGFNRGNLRGILYLLIIFHSILKIKKEADRQTRRQSKSDHNAQLLLIILPHIFQTFKMLAPKLSVQLAKFMILFAKILKLLKV